MTKYGEANGGSFAQAHGMLVFVSIIAGLILMVCGLLGLGTVAKKVPPSIVVGFTIGIAVSIALSNSTYALGIDGAGSVRARLAIIASTLAHMNSCAIGLCPLPVCLPLLARRSRVA